jgi:hypothetical protein
VTTTLQGTLATGGEVLAVECDLPWLARHVVEGSDGQLGDPGPASVHVHVEAGRGPFPTRGWSRLSRDAWARSGRVVLEDVATSGLDVMLSHEPDGVHLQCRWRPPPRTRGAGLLLRARSRLLLRSVLLQYPAMWAAGLHGRTPLHACGMVSPSVGAVLVVGPSGAGKTSLVANELSGGGRATTDNLCTADARSVWGVVEPVRSELGSGRRAPHGRHEGTLASRIESIDPQAVVVLARGERTEVRDISPREAARALVASTYAAGELRRYWPFHAQVALGSDAGDAHPPVAEVASALCERLQCRRVSLAGVRDVRLGDVLAAEGLPR